MARLPERITTYSLAQWEKLFSRMISIRASFEGEALPLDILLDETRWNELDLPGFLSRITKLIREPEIFASATALRIEHGYTSLGVIGFCFGG
ncbi:hypothetical protein CBS12448_1977 [Aspergillus niger]|nr:hypothetical protein CBS12448_1977 [Aspergillus niger]KAI2962985.1 hypothetical protein CBS147324_9229 [Aspergillus niger]KAI2985198.1 hypothetical protein CBS147482_9769 [Aspergillus niger]